jgi:hypothetical protein
MSLVSFVRSASLAALLAGCFTTAGATGGLIHAGHHNDARDARLRAGETAGARQSVGTSVAAGAALGFLCDVVAFSIIASGIDNDPYWPN